MRSRSPLFELTVVRPRPGARDAAQSLYGQLRGAIVEGRLAGGARLPAGRHAQAIFGVSRNTAADVYGRLVAEGFVVARQGAGTFVADAPRARRAAVDERPCAAPDPGPDARLNPFWARPEVTAAIGYWQDVVVDASIADFRPALVSARHFPHAAFRRVGAQASRALERAPTSSRGPQGNQGHRALREAVTRHIAVTRAVACGADDVLVTAGAQQAFDVIARALVEPGETVVAIEDPGYPPMRVAFVAAGARVVTVPVDADGLLVDAIPRDAGVVCVTPSHQFPLGVSLSSARRRQLVRFARTHGAVVVEDDYDGEFRFDGVPLEALRHDAPDLVFYVGTFSKCLSPSLRLGFVVAPRWAVDTLTAAKNASDWHCPVPLQAAVAAFVDGGHLTRHVHAMRERYRARRAILLDALRDDFVGRLAPLPSFYGMHVAALAPDGVDLEAAAVALARDGVMVHTLRRYFAAAPTLSGLVLGYGALDPLRMRRGLAALRAVLV